MASSGADSRFSSTPIFAHLAAGAEGVSAGRGASALRTPCCGGGVSHPLPVPWSHHATSIRTRSMGSCVILMLNDPSAISFYPFDVGAGQSVLLTHLVWCGRMSAGWTKNRPIVSHRFVGRGAASLGVKLRRIVLLAGARRLPASLSHGLGRQLSSTSWCPLLCGRGLGLGPQRRDPLVSGSSSPSVDSAFALPRERADPHHHIHIMRPE